MTTGVRACATRRSRGRPRRLLGAGLAAVLGLTVLVPLAIAHADDTTISYDLARTGWDPTEHGLDPTAASFGQLFDTQLPDGAQVFAQPLVVQPATTSTKVLVAATEHDDVYGLDPVTGTVRWRRNVGTPWPQSTVGCGNSGQSGDLNGITSTPVYDPATDSVYVMAKSNDGPDARHPHWYLNALNPATGDQRPGWPVAIAGTPENNPSHPFNARNANQRPGLLLLGGVVYAGFASYCDHGPFVGYVAGVSTTTHRQTALWSAEAGSNDGEAGIWQSGGGLVSDGPGQIILTTGNGTAAPPSPGDAPPQQLGEAVVRLQVRSDGTLAATDYFSPVNSTELNTDDVDLGSGGPMAVPTPYDGKNLLVQVGKDGRVFLLDRDHLGGSGQGPGGGDDVIGTSGPYNGVWGHPAYWAGPSGRSGSGGYVYDVENQGYLRAFQLTTDVSTSLPTLSSVGTSLTTFGYTSGSPVVTSDGTTAGSAVVWVTYGSGESGANGQLRAYDATPHDGVLRELFTARIGVHEKFTVPATDGGRVFVGTLTGRIYGFGSPTPAPLDASPTNVGDQSVGTSSQPVAVTVTNPLASAVMITGSSTSDLDSAATSPFTVTASPPITVPGHGTTSVPVTFHPTTAGADDSLLDLTTDQQNPSTGKAWTVSFDLSGRGTQPGFAAEPPALGFGEVPTGGTKRIGVNVTNTGTSTETITGASLSTTSSPTQANSLRQFSINPTTGVAVPAGASVAIPVTYAPATAETDTASLVVSGDQGSVVVALSASSVQGAARLTLHPASMDFGTVPLGHTVSKRLTLTNTGNIALTISKAAAPGGEITASQPINEGTPIDPGDSISATLAFRPTHVGPVRERYVINSTAGDGAHNYRLTGSGGDLIAERYAALGGASSPLGAAKGPERSVGAGQEQRYRHGAIYWSTPTGAHVLSGPVLAHYRELGGPTGFAGFPTADVKPTHRHGGSYARFAGHGTSIYWSHATDAHSVNGSIRKRWLATGGLSGRLGYPISDEFNVGAHHRRSGFVGGSITENTRTHALRVRYHH